MKNPSAPVWSEKELRDFDQKAALLRALAHPTRLWIIAQLTARERCVCEFVSAVGVDFSTISKHLAVLKRTGIIAAEKRGKQVFYHLALPCVANFIACAQETLRNQNEASGRNNEKEREG